MVVAAAVPSFDEHGKMVGILYGGDLLNRRHELVDSIKHEVFADETYEGKDIGTVTIFQGDLRISTNVTMADGTRAVGTRMSAAGLRRGARRGGTWAEAGLRRQRLVHHRLRADPRSGGTGSSAPSTSACSRRRSHARGTRSRCASWPLMTVGHAGQSAADLSW